MAHITRTRALDIGAGWIAPSNPGLTCFVTYGYGRSHVPDSHLVMALEEARAEHEYLVADRASAAPRGGWSAHDGAELERLVRYLRAEAKHRGLAD